MNFDLKKRLQLTPAARTIIFYLVLLMSMCSVWVLFTHRTNTQSSAITGDYLRIIGDMTLLTFPYWFMGPRWRRAGTVFPLIISFIALCNIWYYNAWMDIIPPWVYTYASNVDSALLSSVKALWQPLDLWFILLAAVPFAAYWPLRPLDWRPRRKTQLLIAALSLLTILGSFTVRVRSLIIYSKEKYDITKTYPQAAGDMFAHYSLSQTGSMQRGPVIHVINMVRDIYALNTSVALTDRQRDMIADYIRQVPCYTASQQFEANRGKNIIIIVVESLNSDLISRTVGQTQVTPTLNRLLDQPNTIYTTRMVGQTKYGRSVDGQLLINTGLLPLRQGVSIASHRGVIKDLPSLPRLFDKYDAYAVFATEGMVWSEREVAAGIGYKDTYTILDYPDLVDQYGQDGAMFRYALKEIETRRAQNPDTPYLLQLVTASMHVPYEDTAVTRIPDFDIIATPERNYLNSAHYFDANLGWFIDSLKAAGQYDDTVIFIISDHENLFNPNVYLNNPPRVIFAALNSGDTRQIDRATGQVNIFPTILAIMGQPCPEPYHGLGPDILDPDLDSACNAYGEQFGPVTPAQRQAFDVSNLIWASNYFRSAQPQ